MLVCDYFKFALGSENRFSSLPHVWSALFSIRQIIGSTLHILYYIVHDSGEPVHALVYIIFR